MLLGCASLLGRWRDEVAAGWVALLLLGLPFLSNDQLGLLLTGGVALGLGLWLVEPLRGYGERRWCTG